MNKFAQKLYQFMLGRHGIDELYFALLALYAVLTVLNGFAKSGVLTALATAVLVWGMFRFLSRNRAARQRENAAFLRVWRPVRNWFSFQRDRFRDRKTARYRKCPHCRAILKLPFKKGKHTVVCPKCRERFGVRI